MSQSPPANFRIAYLPFYVDYYESVCADFAREKPEIARRCAEELKLFGEVMWNGQLIRDTAGAAAVGKRLAQEKPDVLVILTTIAVFGAIPWEAIRQFPHVPVVVWNVQQIESVGASYSMVEIVRNTGQIGAQALSNTLVREGRWFRVVTGVAGSDAMRQSLRRTLKTIEAASAVRRARLLAVGSTFAGMTDIEIDAEHLARCVGTSIVRESAEALTRAYRESTPLAASRISAAASAKPQADGKESMLSEDEWDHSQRLSAALNVLVERHRADAGTLNCHVENCLKNQEIGITACFALGEQNRAGRPFTCTGDLPTAIAMLLLKRLTGCAMYTEVQVTDERRSAVVIANSGEGEPAIRRASSEERIAPNANFKGLQGRGASFAYPLQPGPATLVSFTPTPIADQPYRLIVAEGEILEDTLPDAGALAGFFRFAHAELHDGYRRWMEAGAVHHAATTLGHWSRELRDVASLMDWDIVEIRGEGHSS